MLEAAALSDYRNFTKNRLSYARYRVGSTWTNAALTDVSIRDDGIVQAQFVINNGGSTITVNRIELYNTDSQLFASQSCSITIESSSSGVLYVFDIDIREVFN